MFTSIKRFFHNLFWKEKRIVKEDPKRTNFAGVHQKQLDDLTVDVNGVGVLNLSDKSDDEVRELVNKLGELNSGPTTVLKVSEGDQVRRLMMSGQARAFTTFNPKLGIEPNAEEASDETYALEAGHVMSEEAASMYRRLCNLKHHRDFQSPEARDNLGGMLSALRSGSWEPGTGKVLDENSPAIQPLLEGGLRRDRLHILSAKTDPAKSVFHSANSLQSEVNHLIAMDPGKFGSDAHAEVDMVVTKLGDEVDCRVTKVKVVKRRLAPLSKNEASKMSKRRVKKESKKVLEVSRGKHRG